MIQALPRSHFEEAAVSSFSTGAGSCSQVLGSHKLNLSRSSAVLTADFYQVLFVFAISNCNGGDSLTAQGLCLSGTFSQSGVLEKSSPLSCPFPALPALPKCRFPMFSSSCATGNLNTQFLSPREFFYVLAIGLVGINNLAFILSASSVQKKPSKNH